MHKISFKGAFVLMAVLICSEAANAREGYSPYSGITQPELKKGGLDYLKKFNTPPPPIKVTPPPKVDFINKSFVIDKLDSTPGDTGERVKMNVFNRGYADAALEVYDAKGKRVGTPILIEGNRPASSVTDFITSGAVSTVKGFTDEYPWNDVRDASGESSKKTTITDIIVPYGGHVKVTKSSSAAQKFNLGTLSLEVLSQFIKLPKGKTVDQRMVTSIAEKIIKLSPDIFKRFASKGELEWEDLTTMVKIAGEVVIDPKNLDGRKAYTKLLNGLNAYKLGSKATLGSFKTAAEAMAVTLNASGQLFDMKNSFNTKREVTLYAIKTKNEPQFSSVKHNLAPVEIIETKSVKYTPKPIFGPAPSSDAEENKSQSTPKYSTAIMQNQLAAITNGGTSHIGSAVYFMGRSPSVDAVRENQHTVAHMQTVREASQYTNGFIIQAPVDIVLRWGATPSDLDSHLTGPATSNLADGTRFHISYSARGSLTSAPNALLYRDVTSSYGPEQTRINTVQPGVYRFYVHDFSNGGNASSTALSSSGATVSLYAAGSRTLPEGNNLGAQVSTMNVPTGQAGTVWNAFELDSRTGILNKVGTITNTPTNQLR